jgi:hypothetical protein
MGELIIPKIYVPNICNPLIFLAGPIKGAPNWQDEAIEILFSQNSDLTIVSPRRGVRDNVSKFIVNGNESFFSRQREWERHYLDIASKDGAILFWLPKEEEHDCQKAYGAMTRFELGQWITNYRHDNSLKFVIGSDGGFSELRTISYDLQLDAPDKEIYDTLERTCLGALKLN